MPEIQIVFKDIEDIQELVDESITQGARLGKISTYLQWCHAGKPSIGKSTRAEAE